MKTTSWIRTSFTWLGLIGIVYALMQPFTYWWLATFLIYNLFALTTSVGYHRLMNHAAFKAHKFWHYFFGIVGCIQLNSSPFYWSIVHSGHHSYSDTPKDPYESSWRYFFRWKARHIAPTFRDIKLYRSNPKLHSFLNDWSLLISVVFMLLCLSISVQACLHLYIIPVTLYLWAVGIHTNFAHYKKQPLNRWYMEYVIPMGGEWIHKVHHEKAGLAKFNTESRFFDLGGIVVDLIRSR